MTATVPAPSETRVTGSTIQRCGPRSQEVAVDPRAATVVGRARPPSSEADGIGGIAAHRRRQTGGFSCRSVTFSLWTVFTCVAIVPPKPNATKCHDRRVTFPGTPPEHALPTAYLARQAITTARQRGAITSSEHDALVKQLVGGAVSRPNARKPLRSSCGLSSGDERLPGLHRLCPGQLGDSPGCHVNMMHEPLDQPRRNRIMNRSVGEPFPGDREHSGKSQPP